MIASGRVAATALFTAAASRTSRTTPSAPSAGRRFALSADREVPMTSCPAARNCGSRREPIAPVAPMTRTRMNRSFSFLREALIGPLRDSRTRRDSGAFCDTAGRWHNTGGHQPQTDSAAVRRSHRSADQLFLHDFHPRNPPAGLARPDRPGLHEGLLEAPPRWSE